MPIALSVGLAAVSLWLLTAPPRAWAQPGAHLAGWKGPDSTREAPQQRRGAYGAERGVYGARITPHWIGNEPRFWYRNDLRGGAKEFILVDAANGTRRPAFDAAKLAAALSKAAAEDYPAERLPFSEIAFVTGGGAIQFEAAGKIWRYDLASAACVAVTNADSTNSEEALTPDGDGQGRGRGRRRGVDRGRRDRDDPSREVASPDAKWTARVKEHNVYVRCEEDGKEYPLSDDGTTNNSYGRLEWAPDSQTLIAWRIEPGDRKEVYLVQSSPAAGGRAVLKTRPYAQPGDKFTRYEPNVFVIAGRAQVKPEVDRFEHEWEAPRLRWYRDGRRCAYQQVDRGHQRLRMIEIDTRTGATRNIIDENSATFIWTAHTEMLGTPCVNWLERTDEFIYVSEMDGWRHLYLVDAPAGRVRNRITKGDWVVRGIDWIDEENREVWFRAGGMNPERDPYFVHYYRIGFDGTGLIELTPANGNHTVQYSPDRAYCLDTYSRVDLPPVHELRCAADGRLVCRLGQADISELKEQGWEPPEVFVAKGRDGRTDIWGVINRPRPFDPSRKYPVLESMYAGPQGAFVPKSFEGGRRTNAFSGMGFVTVQIDGMGTAFRSKAFHDVCWHNLKDAGFPDRILWHQAVARKYPWYDISRVGIFGTSAGGQSAAGAVLFHPEFYRAAVANSGCHDNRLDKASWNEQWMGCYSNVWSNDPENWYSQCSNIDNAARLGGRLLLIVGELDDNVPPESTLRFVDALIKARKDFEMLVVPGANHGAASPVTQRRMQDFFGRYLLGIEPPNRNAEQPGT